MSFRIDPNILNNSGGGSAPALGSGNYTVTASILASLPGFYQAPAMTMNFRAATMSTQYVSPSDRSFAPGFSASGLNRLKIDGTGASLNRSIGTSVRFAKVGSIFQKPDDGSFTEMTVANISVLDPMGGTPKIAAYKLTSTSGMISLFDAGGLLLERCETNGEIIRFAYQEKKNDGTADDLVRVQSVDTGHTVDYGYTGAQITSVTDWAGVSGTTVTREQI